MLSKRILKLLGVSISALLLTACATTAGSGANDGSASVGGAGVEDGKAISSGLGADSNLASNALGADKTKMQVGDQVYYFDFDKSDVYATDRPSIEVQGNYLLAHPKAKIALEGNTDPRGSREYNIGLGERRANAIADILKVQGIKPEQVRVVSYGAEKALGGQSEEDYAKDRHVNFVYENK